MYINMWSCHTCNQRPCTDRAYILWIGGGEGGGLCIGGYLWDSAWACLEKVGVALTHFRYIYVCVCMCVYVCFYKHVCMYVWAASVRFRYICMCVYVCVCIYSIHVCMYVWAASMHVIDICMCVCVCLSVYMYVWLYTHMKIPQITSQRIIKNRENRGGERSTSYLNKRMIKSS